MAKTREQEVFEILRTEFSETQNHGLGELIAVVKKMNLAGRLAPNNPDLQNDKKFGALKQLLIKITELESDTRQGTAILNAIPSGECRQEQCFMEEKWEFFAWYLLTDLKDVRAGDFCRHLEVHLNDCMRCMDTFSDVMRDYHRRYSKFKQGIG